MPKYRKKPVVVEAVRLAHTLEIHTLEGTMIGHEGDWLITGVKGEQYPCKDEIFQATYEPADAPTVESSRIAELEAKLRIYDDDFSTVIDQSSYIADLEAQLAAMQEHFTAELLKAAAAVPHWTRITDDPATWPPERRYILFANHRIWGNWVYGLSNMHSAPGFLKANEYYWLPIIPPEQQP